MNYLSKHEKSCSLESISVRDNENPDFNASDVSWKDPKELPTPFVSRIKD